MSGSDAVRRLITVLDAEERLYVELRDLLQREREHMVNLDARGIEEVVRRKESLSDEGRLLEESRIEVARALARELGLTEASPPLSLLCDHAGADAPALRDAHSRLVALLGAVRELLDANAAFAGECLAQVRTTMGLLGRMLPAEPTYRPGAAGAGVSRAGRLVRSSA